MSMSNANLVRWVEGASHDEVTALDAAMEKWEEKGIRTIPDFFEAAVQDASILALLPSSLVQQAGLRTAHSQVVSIGATSAK